MFTLSPKLSELCENGDCALCEGQAFHGYERDRLTEEKEAVYVDCSCSCHERIEEPLPQSA